MKKKYMLPIGLFLLYAAPLAGGLIRGISFLEIYQFPPLLQKATQHNSFSLNVYTIFLFLLIFSALFLFWPELLAFKSLPRLSSDSVPSNKKGVQILKRLPLHGYLGGVLLALSWACAWGRFSWLGGFYHYFFFPLWLGYILLMDALVYTRRGDSLLTRARGGFWLLFPISSLMWWYFEFLNRFMHNWWYEGTSTFSPAQYLLHSSLCFSTILPAVFETNEFLLSFQYVKRNFSRGYAVKQMSDLGAFSFLCVGVLLLFTMTLFPLTFFFMAWLAPLFIVIGVLRLMRVQTPLKDIARGVYVLPVSLALSSFFCGLLWECWNMFSLPKWHYSLPYVSALPIFEMPLPGYGGYLPFGIICWFGWLMLVYLLPPAWRKQCLSIQSRVNDELSTYYTAVDNQITKDQDE